MIDRESAAAKWSSIDEKGFREAERRIDAAIGRGDAPYYVYLEGVDVSERVRELIVEAYTSGGWKVSIWKVSIRVGDQRDPGLFVVLQ